MKSLEELQQIARIAGIKLTRENNVKKNVIELADDIINGNVSRTLIRRLEIEKIATQYGSLPYYSRDQLELYGKDRIMLILKYRGISRYRHSKLLRKSEMIDLIMETNKIEDDMYQILI